MKLKLTASQMSIWVGQKMNPDIPLYNTACSYHISGEINEGVFKNAFQLLIDTTDAFRLHFVEEAGVPYQSVKAKNNYELETIDFSEHPKDVAISEWMLRRSRQKLNLSQRVFDTALLKIAENSYIWFLNMHHLVTDGVSRKIVFNKMARLYTGLLGEEVEEHMIERPSYLDYVKSELDRAKWQSDKNNYWSDKIRNLEKDPLFYGVRPNVNSTESTRVPICLGPERSRKLKALVQHPDVRGWTEHLTLFNILSSLLFIYAYRVSGQKKLALGAPLHNRVSRKFHNTVGYFLEIFPVVTQINEQDTFNTVLQRVRLENSEALKHALQETVTEVISSSFNMVLNYIHTSFPNFHGFKTTSNWIFTGHIDSTHTLRCHVMDYNVKEEIKIFFDLNHSTFNPELLRRVPIHFLNLLDAMLDDIDMAIEKPGLATFEENRLLYNLDIRVSEPLDSVLMYFEENVLKRPNAVALQCNQEILTYDALNKRSNQLAHYLQKKGIDGKKKVALYFHRSTEYIIGVLAVIKTGGAFIPIASDLPARRIEFILSNSGCSMLLTNIGLVENVPLNTLPILNISEENNKFDKEPSSNLDITPKSENLAYVLYTSGSSGNPKGVLIPHKALSNYLIWARKCYNINEKSVFPLFTSIGFDLTITSTLLPFLSGGSIRVYKENNDGPDMSLFKVLEENSVNVIKLTPSHLTLFKGLDLKASHIRTMIVGGEDFKTQLAKSITLLFDQCLKIYNEYGPTEATIGCIVSEYYPEMHTGTSVPIGKPIANMQAYVLDGYKNPVPKGVVGELYLSGTGLAYGYVNAQGMTDDKFIGNPFINKSKMYRTGDLARFNFDGDLEYLGRTDNQVKHRGYRIELSDIESNLANYPEVESCVVVVVEDKKNIPEDEIVNCTKCGLPSNFPNVDFNENGVCHLCRSFENYKEKAERYFKNEEELVRLLTSKRGQNKNYDCISLLSGGKDSTYVLARLVNMGLKVLAFTMDNGYISNQAKVNIEGIVERLGVDHVYGTTPHMNQIFVDSLHRHHNVCNGCFKTIYTLSTKIALAKEIPFIVTGLSRGQFFETRLTEELFWDETLDTKKIDATILEARKIYHHESDAVKKLLDVSMFEEDAVFDKVEFVDFYRFSDVSLEGMLAYLKDKVGWVRPTDTGRSTNCLINQVGIYVHKKDLGYSNYAFPYSWDVRLGHKTRDISLEEINEVIDEKEVNRIMQEIGYEKSEEDWENSERLVAYYTGSPNLSIKDLKKFMSNQLPSYMVPTVFKHLDEIPLTSNGKVDKRALKNLNSTQLAMDTSYTAPRNEIETLLEGIWEEVLQLKKVGVHDNFIALGGHSLAAIRVTARINEEIEMNFPLNKVFELPTIAEYSTFIRETLTELLEN